MHKMVRLKVKDVKGMSHSVELSEEEVVEKLCLILEPLTHLPTSQQRIVSGGKIWDPKMPVKSYAPVEDQIVYVLEKRPEVLSSTVPSGVTDWQNVDNTSLSNTTRTNGVNDSNVQNTSSGNPNTNIGNNISNPHTVSPLMNVLLNNASPNNSNFPTSNVNNDRTANDLHSGLTNSGNSSLTNNGPNYLNNYVSDHGPMNSSLLNSLAHRASNGNQTNLSNPGLDNNAFDPNNVMSMFGNNGMNFNGRGGPMSNMSLNNPESMAEMFNSPVMRNMMNNPQLLRSILDLNPQLRQLMERNPEINQLLNDPQMLQQSLEMMRNPSLLREMMRSTDRAMINIETMPGGFNALKNMYENVQEPLWDAVENRGEGRTGESDNVYNLDTEAPPESSALPNPWSTTPVPPSTFTPPATGAPPPPSHQTPPMSSMLQNPLFQQILNRSAYGNQTPEMTNAIPPNLGTNFTPMTSPPAEPENLERTYAVQLASLRTMGFTDTPSNIRALQETGGNLNRAIDILLNQTGGEYGVVEDYS